MTEKKIITRDMYHKELQSAYTMGRVLVWAITRDWSVGIFNWLFGFMKGMPLDKKQFISEERVIDLPCSSSSKEKEQVRPVRIRIFRPKGTENKVLPALFYIHGGGTVMCSPEVAMPYYEGFLKRRDCVIICPDYRKSIHHPYPAGFDDCYGTILWAKEHSKELRIFNDNFILAGHSAGGGIVAGLGLKARDTEDFKIAFQMPCYAMLDYRLQTESAGNTTGYTRCDETAYQYFWNHYLKGIRSKHTTNESIEIPVYASPSLNTNYNGLAPTLSYVGALEPACDENVEWIESLKNAGIPTKFKVFEGAFHGFEDAHPDTSIGKEALKFLYDSFEEYFDRYVLSTTMSTTTCARE